MYDTTSIKKLQRRHAHAHRHTFRRIPIHRTDPAIFLYWTNQNWSSSL
ncbi:unnamed protein product [Amoebophrya sp. A120]|nr:unnamed protein product [Amoebophrya sp. A120]|eukprot:GSA120T00023922001.1